MVRFLFFRQVAPGDELVSVDSFCANGLSSCEVARLVRGPAGSRVLLGFRRPQDETAAAEPNGLHFVALQRRRIRTCMPQHASGAHRRPGAQAPPQSAVFLVL